ILGLVNPESLFKPELCKVLVELCDTSQMLAQIQCISSRSIFEQILRNEGREVLFACIVEVATPTIRLKILECFSSARYMALIAFAPVLKTRYIIKWIEMDVMQNIEKVRLLLDKNLLRSSRKERTCTLIPRIKVISISGIEFA